MDQDAIRRYVAAQFQGVDVQVPEAGSEAPEIAWGDTFFIRQGDKNQFPFATIVTKDYGDFDKASDLNRDGVFRLNVGVSKNTFRSLFPEQREWDFTALDVLMPHPVYARQHWVSVLNPSDETFEKLRPLMAEAYAIAARRTRR